MTLADALNKRFKDYWFYNTWNELYYRIHTWNDNGPAEFILSHKDGGISFSHEDMNSFMRMEIITDKEILAKLIHDTNVELVKKCLKFHTTYELCKWPESIDRVV